MTNEERRFAEMLLALKAKAIRGMSWTQHELASIEMCFDKEGELRVLAACCVLTSMRPEGCDRSVGILRETIERKVPLSPYTEEAIYEALTCVKNRKLAPFYDALILFIEDSLRRRAISLVNTNAVLGRLARGDAARRVFTLMQSLTHDDNLKTRENALDVLRRIESD